MEAILEDISIVIKVLVITSDMNKITVKALEQEFSLIVGWAIPYHICGFENLIGFLNHLPDVKVVGEGPAAEVKVGNINVSASIVEFMKSVRLQRIGTDAA